MRKFLVSSATVAAVFLITGCEGSPMIFACPAIGYSSVASIDLVEPREGLQLELCAGKGCTPGPVEMPVEIGSTANPLATGIYHLDGNSKTGWTATLLNTPTRMGYRVAQADGITTIAEGYLAVEWTRVDGSAQCGGNHAAELLISA